MIHIYTGDGKGKTTASFGIAIRMLGHGKKVCLIQFMKKNYEYGEILFFSKIENIDIYQFGSDKLIEPNNPTQADIEEAHGALQQVFLALQDEKYDIIIVDEINVAVAWGLIDLEDQKRIFAIKTKAEVIMTGRYAHPEVIAMADLVTEMKEIKHYFQKNIQARKGIEY
jgi:cob(I)alamin adenosyltransferase